MNSLRAKIYQVRVKFKMGDLVKITKEKLQFAKWDEHFQQKYSE